MNIGREKARRKLFLQLIFVFLVFIFSLFLSRELARSDALLPFIDSYGALAIIVISFISGFNLIIPIPAASLSPIFFAAGFTFPFVVVLMTVGMVLADSVAYFVGRAGRGLLSVSQKRMLESLERWQEKRVWLIPLFVFIYAALVPIPNEVILVPVGLLGYRLRYLLPSLVLGSVIFNVLVGYGVNNIFMLLM